MILISISTNDFDSKSNNDLNNFDLKSKNEIDRIIVLTLNLKQAYQNNE